MIIIPSYKRAQSLCGSEYFGSAKYVVPESQRDEYAGVVGAKRVIAIPDHCDGNIARKRNWILRNIPRPFVMIDDDVDSIGYFEGRGGMKNGDHRPKTLDANLVDEWIARAHDLAGDLGSKMWGIAQNEDNRICKEFQPFSLCKIVLGPFQGHLQHDLLFDENAGTKDDYDMALQQLRSHRILLRFNKFHYMAKHGNNQGGIVGQRSKCVEERYCRYMMKKWGTKIIKYQLPPAGMTDLLNAKHVKIPVRGV